MLNQRVETLSAIVLRDRWKVYDAKVFDEIHFWSPSRLTTDDVALGCKLALPETRPVSWDAQCCILARSDLAFAGILQTSGICSEEHVPMTRILSRASVLAAPAALSSSLLFAPKSLFRAALTAAPSPQDEQLSVLVAAIYRLLSS